MSHFYVIAPGWYQGILDPFRLRSSFRIQVVNANIYRLIGKDVYDLLNAYGELYFKGLGADDRGRIVD